MVVFLLQMQGVQMPDEGLTQQNPNVLGWNQQAVEANIWGNVAAISSAQLPSQSAPTILVLKNWVGLRTWNKLGWFAAPKKRGWIFLLFKKRRSCLASSLLDCKLQAEKIWSRYQGANILCSVQKSSNSLSVVRAQMHHYNALW